MLVETYEIEAQEGNELCDEEQTEIIKLIDDLGLEGQKELVDKSSETIFPYREMTQEEINIYSTLLSTHTEVKNFRASIIPLRVLQIIAHVSQDTSKIGYLEIWHNEHYKDPILVGKKERYGRTHYILARWGDELESMAQLKAKAISVLRTKAQSWSSGVKARLDGFVAGMESHLIDFLNGQSSDWKPSSYKLCDD